MIDNVCSEFQRSHEVGGQEGIVHNHKDILGLGWHFHTITDNETNSFLTIEPLLKPP